MRWSWLTVIVTLGIIYLAITRLNFGLLIESAANISGLLVLSAFGVWIIVLLAKSIKWKWVIAGLDGNISMIKSIRVLLIGLFIGVITPGRIGDFIRVLYIKDELKTGKGIMAVVIDRVLDIGTLILFAVIATLFLVSNTGHSAISLPLLAVTAGAFILLVFIGFNRHIAKKIWKILKRFLPDSLVEMISHHAVDFYDSIPILLKNKKFLVGSLVFSVGAWLATVTMGYILMLAVGIEVDWQVALIVIPAISLIEIIPFGIAGVGTRELAAVVTLSLFGVSPEVAILFSMLYFVVGYSPSFVVGGILFNKEPPALKKNLSKLVSAFKSGKIPSVEKKE
ncbi:MAG: lysylphosphatidylglycerol synthase transmembrane domain-containing protein [archaeon]